MIRPFFSDHPYQYVVLIVQLGIHLDGSGVIRDGEVIFALAVMGNTPVVKGSRTFWIDLNRLVVIGNGLIVPAILRVNRSPSAIRLVIHGFGRNDVHGF